MLEKAQEALRKLLANEIITEEDVQLLKYFFAFLFNDSTAKRLSQSATVETMRADFDEAMRLELINIYNQRLGIY